MIEIKELIEGVWTFPIVLPNNPLKWLNCYVIKGESNDRNLLIDTGFNQPACTDALLEGLSALNLKPDNTDIFLTHLHADHTGNAELLQRLGYTLLMGEMDYRRSCLYNKQEHLKYMCDEAMQGGMPREVLEMIFQRSPAFAYKSRPFRVREMHDGDLLCYGKYTLQCLHTPGHTPGHMCLYDEANQLIFLGDHVLFDITPNICTWPEFRDSLGTYLKELKKLKEIPITTAFPAHRSDGGISVSERVDELLAHHKTRASEMLSLIEKAGTIDTYSLTARMTWRIRSRNWDEFPVSQKWFAFGETRAHLDYLLEQALITQEYDGNGVVQYRCT